MRKEGSESTEVIRGGLPVGGGFERMVGLDRKKQKCLIGKSGMLSGRHGGGPSEKALEAKLAHTCLSEDVWEE